MNITHESLYRNRDGEKVYRGVADENTAHIQKMVSAQKSNKKKPKRGAPYKVSTEWSSQVLQ